MQKESWSVVFYEDERGRRPVSEFLATLSEDARTAVVRDMTLLREFGIAVSFPTVRPVEGVRKLWELRTKTVDGAVRIFYVAQRGRQFILLHGFIKKTSKTPRQELAIATKRLRAVLNKE